MKYHMNESEVKSAFFKAHPEYMKRLLNTYTISEETMRPITQNVNQLYELYDKAKEDYGQYLQKLYNADMIPLYLYKQSSI